MLVAKARNTLISLFLYVKKKVTLFLWIACITTHYSSLSLLGALHVSSKVHIHRIHFKALQKYLASTDTEHNTAVFITALNLTLCAEKHSLTLIVPH